MYTISPEQQQKLMALYERVYQDTKGEIPDIQTIISRVLDEYNITFKAAIAHNTGGYSADYLAVLELLRELVLIQNMQPA
jgi:hypothetical protein